MFILKLLSTIEDKNLLPKFPCHFINLTKYHSYNQIPFYGSSGLNAGLMHMNFTRMKNFPDGGWIEANMKVFDQYKQKIVLADQDILNILFNKVRPQFCFTFVNAGINGDF